MTRDAGGLVNNAQGVKNKYTYDCLKCLDDDKFEQRAFAEAGNNVRTQHRSDYFTAASLPMASSMPRIRSSGAGGQPRMTASTGMTFDTAPQDA